MTAMDDFLSAGYSMLESLDGETITYTEVDSSGSTAYASLTALVQDLPDTGEEVRRYYFVPTSTLSRDPSRQDTVTDANSDIWTVIEVDKPENGRCRVEVAILQTRG